MSILLESPPGPRIVDSSLNLAGFICSTTQSHPRPLAWVPKAVDAYFDGRGWPLWAGPPRGREVGLRRLSPANSWRFASGGYCGFHFTPPAVRPPTSRSCTITLTNTQPISQYLVQCVPFSFSFFPYFSVPGLNILQGIVSRERGGGGRSGPMRLGHVSRSQHRLRCAAAAPILDGRVFQT